MRLLALFANRCMVEEPPITWGRFRPRDTPMSDEQQASAGHYREIAEKIRQLARQARIPEAQQELFDLADRLDRMADLARPARVEGGAAASDADRLDCRMSRAGAVDLAGKERRRVWGIISTPLPARAWPGRSRRSQARLDPTRRQSTRCPQRG